jgi:hypothetical protein
MLESLGPRASAIGYHRVYAIRQSTEMVRRELTDVRFPDESCCGKWQNVAARSFVTFPQMLSEAAEWCGGQSATKWSALSIDTRRDKSPLKNETVSLEPSHQFYS